MDGVSNAAMMKQAQQIWSMLDDMAENDPKAYKKFIEKQKADGMETAKPPEPHMCVQTDMLKPEKCPFYINFCKWKKVPAPTGPEEPCKVAGSAVGQLTSDHKGEAAVTGVAFAEKVLDDYGKDAINKADRDTLIQIAMDFIEKQHSTIKLSRKYKILDRTHIGNLKVIQDRLQQAFTAKNKVRDEHVADVLKQFAPLATENPATLLQQLNTENDSSNTDSLGENIAGIDLNIKPGKSNCLIEEVSSSSTFPEPTYDLREIMLSGLKAYELKISLPGVQSVSECELDISKDDVSLYVEEKFDLKLPLPATIDDSKAKAKFNKKTSVLTLTMPIERL